MKGELKEAVSPEERLIEARRNVAAFRAGIIEALDWDDIAVLDDALTAALSQPEGPPAMGVEEENQRLRDALKFYRDNWTFYAVGDEGDGVTDFGRLDGYEAEPTAALKADGGERARAAISEGRISATNLGLSQPEATGVEEAARIIDPTAFDPMTGHIPLQRQADALAKARRILTISPQPVPVRDEEGVG